MLRRSTSKKIDLTFGEAPQSMSGMRSGISDDARTTGPPASIGNGTGTGRSGVPVRERPDSTSYYVTVTIDEKGQVIDASLNDDGVERKLADKIRKRALTWTFRPYVVDGKPGKMRARMEVRVI
jgi:hypothetical protein